VVRALVVLASSLALGACASMGAGLAPGPGAAPEPAAASARTRLAVQHNERAETLEQLGQLRQALDERTIALTIDPGDARARAAVGRLEGMIERGVAQRIEEGRLALSRGSHVEARRRFLAALALDPSNRVAFEALRTEVREIEFITHVVRQGDTLAALGQRYYGDRARAEVIGEMNELTPGARLVVGRTLKIPEIPGVPFVRPEPKREGPPRPTVAKPEAPTPGGAPTTGNTETPSPPLPAKEEPAEVSPLLLEAQEAFDRRDYVTTLADVDKLLATSPSNQEALGLKKQALYGQGKAQLEAKNYEASHRSLTQLAKLAPNHENIAALNAQVRGRLIEQRYSQGIRLFREEKLQEAILAWRGVLELDPNHVNARKNIEQSERLLKGLEERRKK
jgi:tetratricopeptide (TPR) repeat protein